MTNLVHKYNIELKKYSNLQWKVEDSNANSILFYKINPLDPKALEKFNERVSANKSFGLCITNITIDRNDINLLSIEEKEWMSIQKELSDYYYPFEKKSSFCVTGTNGKTTTVDMFRQLVLSANKRIMTIGTLGVWINENQELDFSLTSPSYIDFRKILNKYSKNVDYIAVEVSSHALTQKRFFQYSFDYGAWTSFSQDHLDYHDTMENYFSAKELIFKCVSNKVFVNKNEKDLINKLRLKKQLKIVSFNLDINTNPFLKVEYNKKNLSLAIAACNELNINYQKSHLVNLKPAPGRFNIEKFRNGYIIIDFAHTPDALENICKAIKQSFPNRNLITLFGCGGDRDRSKRNLMAKAAEENSDYLFITSDNPRFEKPEKIIKDVLKGVSGQSYKVIIEREIAIKSAMHEMKDEVLLIAGKGHEQYLDIKGKKIPYSDQSVIKKVKEND